MSIHSSRSCFTRIAFGQSKPGLGHLVSVEEESCTWLKIIDVRYHSKRNKDISLQQSFLTGITDLDMGRTQITDLLLTPRSDTNLRQYRCDHIPYIDTWLRSYHTYFQTKLDPRE